VDAGKRSGVQVLRHSLDGVAGKAPPSRRGARVTLLASLVASLGVNYRKEMGMFERKILVEVRRKSMTDEGLLELFKGGPEQAAVVGVNEICQRLEDAMILAGIGERDPEERAALMRDVGTVREVRNQMMSFATEALKRK
jgi:hypothetical protein